MMKQQFGRRFSGLTGLVAGLGACVFLAMSASTAEAALTIRLTSGSTTVTVTDGGAGDLNSATANAVLFSGLVDNWNVFVAGALSKGAGFALDIASQQSSSSSAGTLTIEVSDTDFSASGSASKFAMSGSYSLPASGGSVTYMAYESNSNTLFAMDNLIGTVSGSGTTSVSGTAATDLSGLTNPFSLTQVVTITHNAAGISSGNSELRVPEPGTLGLLGIGLMLLGFMGRIHKMRRQAAAA